MFKISPNSYNIHVKNLSYPHFKSNYPIDKCNKDSFEHDFTLVGETSIRLKCGKIKLSNTPVQIYKSVQSGGKSETYYLLRKKDNNLLGEISLQVDQPTIFISNLESYGRRKYSGIGSKLIQIALEKSMECKHDKKVALSAQKLHIFQFDPIGFYEHIGFTTEQDQNIGGNLYGQVMSMYLLEQAHWMEQIKNHPILKQ